MTRVVRTEKKDRPVFLCDGCLDVVQEIHLLHSDKTTDHSPSIALCAGCIRALMVEARLP